MTDTGSGVVLDSAWPGLDAAGSDLRVDPEVVEQVGDRLVSRADSLSSDMSGLPSSVPYLAASKRSTTQGFESATEVPEGERWFGRWQTAADMEHGLRTAQWCLSKYYRELVGELREAGRLLSATAERYRGSDVGAALRLESAAAGGQAAGVDGGAGGAGPVPVRDSTPVPKVAACENVYAYSPEQILELVEELKRQRSWVSLGNAAAGFGDTAERLRGLADFVRSQAQGLAEAWCSPVEVECQEVLRRIAGTAEHLAERASGVERFARDSADQMLTQVNSFPEWESRSFGQWLRDTATVGSDPHRDEQVQQIRDAFQRLNDAYMAVNSTHLPSNVDIDLAGVSREDVIDRQPELAQAPAPPSFSPPAAGGGPASAPVGGGGSGPSAVAGFDPGGSSASPGPVPPTGGGVPPVVSEPPSSGGLEGVGPAPAPPAAAGPGVPGVPPAGGGVPPAAGGVVPPGGGVPPVGLAPGGSGAGVRPGAPAGPGVPGAGVRPGAPAGPGVPGAGVRPGGPVGSGVAPGGVVGATPGGHAAAGRGAAPGAGAGVPGGGRAGTLTGPVGAGHAAGGGVVGAAPGSAAGQGRGGAPGAPGAAGGQGQGGRAGGVPGVAAGAGAGAGGGAGGGSAGRAGVGGAMMPVGGRSAAVSGEERVSRSDDWLREDDPVFQTADLPPGVIRS